jgi:hypothetical protein
MNRRLGLPSLLSSSIQSPVVESNVQEEEIIIPKQKDSEIEDLLGSDFLDAFGIDTEEDTIEVNYDEKTIK